MRRLFDESNHCYTSEGMAIQDEVYAAIEAIMKKHIEVDARDLSLVVINGTYGATLSMTLDRKG